MSVWKCPHCTSVSIVAGSDEADQRCPNLGCRGIMEQLEGPEAAAAVVVAARVIAAPRSFAEQLEGVKAFNKSLKQFAATLDKPEAQS